MILPGGFGTLDEMFDTLVGYLVGEHDKRTIIYNPNNYWTHLIEQIKRMEQEQTAQNAPTTHNYTIAETIEDLRELLKS